MVKLSLEWCLNAPAPRLRRKTTKCAVRWTWRRMKGLASWWQPMGTAGAPQWFPMWIQLSRVGVLAATCLWYPWIHHDHSLSLSAWLNTTVCCDFFSEILIGQTSFRMEHIQSSINPWINHYCEQITTFKSYEIYRSLSLTSTVCFINHHC